MCFCTEENDIPKFEIYIPKFETNIPKFEILIPKLEISFMKQKWNNYITNKKQKLLCITSFLLCHEKRL